MERRIEQVAKDLLRVAEAEGYTDEDMALGVARMAAAAIVQLEQELGMVLLVDEEEEVGS